MKNLKIIGSILMTLVILASTIGIDLRIHRCSGMKKTEVSYYPSILGNNGECCKINKLHAGYLPFDIIQKPTCCKNNSVFSKVASVTFNQYFSYLINFSCPAITVSENPSAHCLSASEKKNPEYLLFRPPPLSGKAFVVFIQQIRIPAPSDLA